MHAWRPSRYTTAAADVARPGPTALQHIRTACGVPPLPPNAQLLSTLSLPPPPSSSGMAGSGKTTLIQQINAYLHSKQQPGYIINLDPAVTHMPYPANIDIRDTVRDCRVIMSFYYSFRQTKTFNPNATHFAHPPHSLRSSTRM